PLFPLPEVDASESVQGRQHVNDRISTIKKHFRLKSIKRWRGRVIDVCDCIGRIGDRGGTPEIGIGVSRPWVFSVFVGDLVLVAASTVVREGARELRV